MLIQAVVRTNSGASPDDARRRPLRSNAMHSDDTIFESIDPDSDEDATPLAALARLLLLRLSERDRLLTAPSWRNLAATRSSRLKIASG